MGKKCVVVWPSTGKKMNLKGCTEIWECERGTQREGKAFKTVGAVNKEEPLY